MASVDRTYTAERLARIEQMIEDYRAGTQHRLMQRAIKLWGRGEACQKLVELDTQPERVH